MPEFRFSGTLDGVPADLRPGDGRVGAALSAAPISDGKGGFWTVGEALANTQRLEGRPGATILRGTVPPVPADGKDGDYYIEDRTASGQGRRMWGPKAGGAWLGTPWNIQVARYTDVPGLPEAIGDPAQRGANLGDLTDKSAARSNIGLRGVETVQTYGTPVDGVLDLDGLFGQIFTKRGPIDVPRGSTHRIGGIPIWKNSAGRYDYQAPDKPSYDGFLYLRETGSTDNISQRTSYKIQTNVLASCGHSEVGMFNIFFVYGGTQEHIGHYIQAGAYNDATGFITGQCIEVFNTRVDGTGSTQEGALNGLEIDVVNKWQYDGTNTPLKRKIGLSIVAFGGGTAHDATGIYPGHGEGHGNGYYSGDFLNAHIIYEKALHPDAGAAYTVRSDHFSGLRLTGKTKGYGILLEGPASAGNIGIDIGSGYAIPLVLRTDRAIRWNGADGVGWTYREAGVGSGAFTIDGMPLSLRGSTLSNTAAGGAVALPPGGYKFVTVYIDGSATKVLAYNP